MTQTVFILNGPNLNLFGTRQPEIYGYETLETAEAAALAVADEAGLAIEFRQSNHEGDLVDWIQEARDNSVGIIINPGGYSHTSIAIMDALLAYEGQVIEVHASNIYKRDAFRHHSYISLAADVVIAGAGMQGYAVALRHLISKL